MAKEELGYFSMVYNARNTTKSIFIIGELMPIYSLGDKTPKISASSYIHPTAVIIGDVLVDEHCWIGPNATLRADFHKIHIQYGSDVQDNCVIHGDTILGPKCRMGHGAIVHGAVLEEGVLISMNAVVLDGVRLGKGVVVAAGSVVAPQAQVPAGKLVMGVPGAVIGNVPTGMQKAGKDEDYSRMIPIFKNHLIEISVE